MKTVVVIYMYSRLDHQVGKSKKSCFFLMKFKPLKVTPRVSSDILMHICMVKVV